MQRVHVTRQFGEDFDVAFEDRLFQLGLHADGQVFDEMRRHGLLPVLRRSI